MTTYTIDVTQDDIDNGIRVDACECPVARAVKRATGTDLVTVNTIGINGYEEIPYPDHYYPGETWQRTQWGLGTPKIVRDFVRAFDAGEPVPPFTFQIEVPE